ncbi:MAG: hypothetical protein J5I99_02700 [Verrucomicrobia bacterium]|nr:hypothetical protein [Verrucomicrobiota bacterium]
MRPLKLLIGLFLLPVVWTAIRATARLIATLRIEEFGGHPQAAWWLAGGFLFWLLLYLLLPRPMRTYVLGHELTHAFWALLMGARVSRLRVTARGGSVTVSKSNWIITLAPYFFPFYTMLVIASAFVLGLFFNLQPYERLTLAIIGFTYAFHITFTISMLTIRQPDVQEHGRLFSYTIIILLNTLGLGCWIVVVAAPTLADYASHLTHEALLTWDWLREVYAMLLSFAPPR